MNLGDIYFTFRGESQQLEADAKKSGAKAGDTTAKSFKDRFKGAIKGNLGQSLAAGFGMGAGLGAFGLVTSALSGVVAIAGEAQQAYSDLSEQQAKLGEVFSQSEQEILDWSKGAATSMGLSSRAALEAAGTFGNFLQAMGVAEQESAKMSMSMVQLASDLASFNNTAGGSEEVLEAIAAGLRGETEPMMRFGVVLLEANVQAKALELGFKSVNGRLTDGAKVAARYALILEKTVKAQGDYARTAMSSANQERTLAALRENALAVWGRYIDNIVRLGQAFAMELLKPMERAAGFFEDIERWLNRDAALFQDTRDLLLEQAEALGINTDGVLALMDAERKHAQEAALKKSADRTAEALQKYRDMKAGLIELHGQERYEVVQLVTQYMFATGATKEQILATDGLTVATEYGAEATAEAARILEVWNSLSEDEQKQLIASRNETDALTKKTWGLNQALTTLGGKVFDAVKTGAKEAGAGLQEMAQDADLAKGSFKSFWESVEEQQKRVRFFIRNPDKLKEELDKIESAIQRAERRKAKLMDVEAGKRNVAAIAAQDQLIRDLRSKAAEWQSLGIVYGNRLEQGLERAFDPTLANPLIVGGQPKRPRREHSGGRVRAHVPLLVGDYRHEELFLPDVGGRIVDAGTTRDAMSGIGGGDSYTFNTTVNGSPNRSMTPFEIAQQLRRQARFGVAPPRRAPSWSMP